MYSSARTFMDNVSRGHIVVDSFWIFLYSIATNSRKYSLIM